MAQPLTDAITALTTYANGVTGASDTTLSDAVRTLADGYGQGGGGGTPVTVTVACATAQACLNHLIPNPQTGTIYYICTTAKQSAFVTDQLINVNAFHNGNNWAGGGTRYRGNAMAFMSGVSNTYDAKINPGDVYTVIEYDTTA